MKRSQFPRQSCAYGFTLIELLVAITILAVVAVLGWRGLDSIVRARVALTQDLEQTRGLQIAFAQLQNDCAHLADAAAIGGRMPIAADENRLAMVRTVFAENQPSRVQIVEYRVQDGVLQRRESPATRDLGELDNFWQAAASGGEQMLSVALQADVAELSMRSWLAGSSNWTPTGAGAVSGAMQGGMPVSYKGLEVSLQLRGSANKMIKVFLLGPV